MNLSLRKRVFFAFLVPTFLAIVLTLTVFGYLSGLNNDIEQVAAHSSNVSILTDEIRISAVAILKYQRRIMENNKLDSSNEIVEKVIELSDRFISQLDALGNMHTDPNAKEIVIKMRSYVDSLKLFLTKGMLGRGRVVEGSNKTIGEIADKILEAFTEFQDVQQEENKKRNTNIKSIISETKRKMLMTLVFGFLATVLLGLIIPGKVALPFKKIRDAVSELQECNFDVSIYYNQDDEIGELAREINKMIANLKTFEELRSDRITLELRKFNALANLVKRNVMVANADGKIVYMNNNLYSLMQIGSEDVIGKSMKDTVIPESIISSYEMAIKRRAKIENAEIEILARHIDVEDSESLKTQATTDAKSIELDKNDEGIEVVEIKPPIEVIFKGYANVMPIRGKDSSQDYYLMVMSTETFS